MTNCMNETYLEQTQFFVASVNIIWLLMQTFAVVLEIISIICLNQVTARKSLLQHLVQQTISKYKLQNTKYKIQLPDATFILERFHEINFSLRTLKRRLA